MRGHVSQSWAVGRRACEGARSEHAERLGVAALGGVVVASTAVTIEWPSRA
jgi:hypothetical protein